jgi:hypothetical protein
MLRLFTALLSVTLALSPAFAQDPTKVDPAKSGTDKPAEPAKPTPVASVTLMTLAVKDGMFTRTQTVPTQVAEQVPVSTRVNGRNVTTFQTVVTTRMVVQEVKTSLKDIRATGIDGKEVAGEEVEKRLKDGGTVVMYTGTLDPEMRKVFKDGTLFIDHAAAIKAPAAPATTPPTTDK